MENKREYLEKILTDLIETYEFKYDQLVEAETSNLYGKILLEVNILLDLFEENNDLSPIDFYITHLIIENKISRLSLQLNEDTIHLLESRILSKPLTPIKKLASVIGKIKRKVKRGVARKFGHKIGKIGTRLENKPLLKQLSTRLKKYGHAYELITHQDTLEKDNKQLNKSYRAIIKNILNTKNKRERRAYKVATDAIKWNEFRNNIKLFDLERKLNELGF